MRTPLGRCCYRASAAPKCTVKPYTHNQVLPAVQSMPLSACSKCSAALRRECHSMQAALATRPKAAPAAPQARKRPCPLLHQHMTITKPLP